MSVKRARKGMPEGLPRRSGVTFRWLTPCAKPALEAAAIHKKSRRVMEEKGYLMDLDSCIR